MYAHIRYAYIRIYVTWRPYCHVYTYILFAHMSPYDGCPKAWSMGEEGQLSWYQQVTIRILGASIRYYCICDFFFLNDF